MLETGQAKRSHKLEELWKKDSGYVLFSVKFFYQIDFATEIGCVKKLTNFLFMFPQISIG